MLPTLPEDLLTVLSTLDGPQQLSLVLQDLLTAAETESIRERWEIVKRLDRGMSQREVSQTLGVSVTTVTRGNKQLKYGSGGFHLALDVRRRLKSTEAEP